MENVLRTRITKTLWRAYNDTCTMYILTYNDGSKYYRWDDWSQLKEWTSNPNEDYWFKFYWDYIRMDIKNSHYRIEIEKFNDKGKLIKKYDSDWTD